VPDDAPEGLSSKNTEKRPRLPPTRSPNLHNTAIKKIPPGPALMLSMAAIGSGAGAASD
jgi:hypothetical protein